jgi:integrase/recombinase XerC/integrase/recombinase XerD
MNTTKPILQLMDEFLANQDIAENSRKRYRDCLHFFIYWLSRYGSVSSPNRAQIIDYKKYLIASKRSASTIDNYLSPVRQFFKYLEEVGICENVAVGITSPKRSSGFRKDYLREPQVKKLLDSINRSTLQGERDYAVINLMVRTGMRCIEVSRSDVRDLNLLNGNWVIDIQGKGRISKDRRLGITPMVVNPIESYLESRNKHDGICVNHPMFMNHCYVSRDTRLTPVTISKFVKKYLRVIGIDNRKVTAHSLRHTFAITALKNGATLLEVSSALGHSDIKTTMIYQEAIEEERMLEGTAVRKMDDLFK